MVEFGGSGCCSMQIIMKVDDDGAGRPCGGSFWHHCALAKRRDRGVACISGTVPCRVPPIFHFLVRMYLTQPFTLPPLSVSILLGKRPSSLCFFRCCALTAVSSWRPCRRRPVSYVRFQFPKVLLSRQWNLTTNIGHLLYYALSLILPPWM